MKKNFIIGTIVSAFFLYLALRGIEWDVLWRVLRETRAAYIVPAVLAGLLSHYTRSYRWKFMLLPIKRISTASLFSATMIGFMANNLLPARLGEIVRAYALGRREQISRTASFATIVYERIVDVFCLLVLLWIMLMNVPGPEWMRRTAVWLLAANVLLMIAMLAMEKHRGLVTRLVERAARRLRPALRDKIHQATQGYLGGLSGMTSVRTLLPIALGSVPVWGFAMLGIYLCFGALGMDLPPVATVALVVLVAMGSMIPSAPAFLGTTQYACVVGLGLFGIGKTEALAYSILYHAMQFFPVTILGFYYLSKSRIRFSDISKR
jgi:uncharacterized protein (TIRG00374 family)